MIFPIGDDNTGRRTTPYLNFALIAINVVVFVFLQGLGANDKFTYAFSAVPAEIASGKDIDRPIPIRISRTHVAEIRLEPTPVSVYLTLLTSMFMHGGIAHLLGNMLFLFIFGDNLEDRMGRGRYLAFYLLCGLIASLSHVFSTIALDANPYIPSLGASGAISGVLGGYLILFPHNRVRVIFFRFLTEVPAIVAIGIWFAFQVIESLGTLGGGSRGGGGVAYAAHIGGFIAGLVLVKAFMIGRSTSLPMYRSF